MFDLIIRDATIVSGTGRQVADVAVRDGRIAYVGPRPPRGAREELSAIGKFLMPGVVDLAVDFTAADSPEDEAEAWSAESAAAVTGGVTTAIALPGGAGTVLDRVSAQRRFQRASRASWCDFALWGRAEPDNVEELSKAWDAGVIAGTLAIGLTEAEPWLDSDRTQATLAVRAGPPEDVERVVELVRRRARPAHLLHVSSANELDLVDPVNGELPLTIGVTPHHLFLTSDDEDLRDVRPEPPLCPEQDRRTLWTAIRRGRLHCVASDHRASSREDQDGIPSSEVLLPLMMAAAHYGRLSLEAVVGMCCEAPSTILGLPHKGRIAKGADADLVLYTEGAITKLTRQDLLSRAAWSPYLRREVATKPDMVFVGGHLVARAGNLVTEAPVGRHVLVGKPNRAA